MPFKPRMDRPVYCSDCFDVRRTDPGSNAGLTRARTVAARPRGRQRPACGAIGHRASAAVNRVVPARKRSRWRPRQTVTRDRPWTCHAPSRPTTAVSSSMPEHDRPARCLERDQRGERLGPRVVVGHDRRARREPEARAASAAARAATPARGSRRRGRPGPSPRPSSRPGPRRARARPPAPGRPRVPSRTRRRYAGLAARQVDEIGLADAWAAAGSSAPARSRTSTGSTSAPSAPKCATPIDAQRWNTSSPSGYEAVGRIATRGRDRTGRREELGVEIGHRGKELTGADERHGSGHGGESICDDCPHDRRATRPAYRLSPSMTPRQRWTLVATVIGSGAVFLDGTIVNVALSSIGRELPGDDLRRPRGPDLHRQRLPRGPRRAADPRRRAVRPLRPAPGLRDRPRGLRRDLGAVRARPDARVAGHLPAAPGRGRRTARPGLARAHHPHLRRRRARPGVRHLGGGDGRPDRRSGRSSAGCSSTPSAGGSRSSINVPLLAFALWVTLRHVAESRDTEATGRFDWLGAVVAALAVGGLSFGLDPRPGQRVAGPGRLDLDRDRRRSPSSPSRS